MRELSYREAAQLLNVSSATVKNWTRQGLLSTGNSRKPLESDIQLLKKKLKKKKNLRLTSRANKSAGVKRFIPNEYIEDNISRKKINTLAETLKTIKAEIPQILLSFSLYLIERAGLSDNKVSNSDPISRITHKGLSEEIRTWHRELKQPPILDLNILFSNITIPVQRDTAGLIYQMLQSEGRKSNKGSYYTPPAYTDEVLNLYGKKGQKFLDPCCGSGIFLLAAAEKYGSPENIHGWDSDITAVHLARINLMLYFRYLNFTPNIFHKNSLTKSSDERFDLIATNPPWGHHYSIKNQKIISNNYEIVKTGESFSFFIEAGLHLLKKNGILSYLLPESLLKVKTHKDIRKKLLENVHIRYIKFLGKPFCRVQTNVIRLDLSKNSDKKTTTVFRNNKIYSVNCTRFFKNPYFLFDFNCTERDCAIIEKIYMRNNETLKKDTLWILGIVSGNNDKFITKEANTDNLPFISGGDVHPFRIKEPEKFIYFNREILQQSAPFENYRTSPKIIYKFITGKPVFAIDRTGYVTLNSANSFYPKKEMPLESIVALFNSQLYRFVCRKKFNSIKVLRSHLEQLPLPRLDEKENVYLKKLVLQIEQSKNLDNSSLIEKIDDYIFKFFNISECDRKYIRENI